MTDTNEQLAIFRESIKRRDVHLAELDERRRLSWGSWPYGPGESAAAEAAAQDALLAAQSLDEALSRGSRPPDAWKASQMLTGPHSAPAVLADLLELREQRGDFRDEDREVVWGIVTWLREEFTVEPFKCPAVYHHGPGSQSRTRCERKAPHDLDDEHYARNPMCPDFEWTGQDG